jgi:hypothetical protein
MVQLLPTKTCPQLPLQNPTDRKSVARSGLFNYYLINHCQAVIEVSTDLRSVGLKSEGNCFHVGCD